MRTIFMVLAALALSACAVTPRPGAYAERQPLDEQRLVRAEHRYQAVAAAMLAASRAGVVPDRLRSRIAATDLLAYLALRGMRAAYGRRDAVGFARAGDEAEALMGDVMTALGR